MTISKKNTEPSSAELDAEVQSIGAELQAEELALQKWDQDNDAGEDVDYTAKPKLRTRIEALRDRITNAQARKVKALRRERLAELADLRARIEAEEAADSTNLHDLVRNVLKANVALRKACSAREERLRGYHQALNQKGVPAHIGGAPEPSPEHGGMGWTHQGELALGTTRLKNVGAQGLLEQVDHLAILEATDHRDAPTYKAKMESKLGLSYEVRQVEGARHFRSKDGSNVFTFGPEGPNETMLAGLGEEISEKLANTIWWSKSDAEHARRLNR